MRKNVIDRIEDAISYSKIRIKSVDRIEIGYNEADSLKEILDSGENPLVEFKDGILYYHGFALKLVDEESTVKVINNGR